MLFSRDDPRLVTDALASVLGGSAEQSSRWINDKNDSGGINGEMGDEDITQE